VPVRIINVPIEPLDERYTEQWFRWFPAEFERLGVPYVNIIGEALTGNIQRGVFLDAISTNHYKATQLKEIMRLLHTGEICDDDVFLFHDYWFPGVEMLAYVRDTLGLKFKIAGWLHAGTYDPWDFLAQKGLDYWGRELENSWFKIADFLFFNSYFHKELACHTRVVDREKAFAMGSIVYPEGIPTDVPKENIVVFPHRLCPEKQPELFDSIAEKLRVDFPDWQFVKSQEIKRNKRDYYHLLASSKIAVSCNLQETFGLSMVEAVMAGCIPVVPNRLSYVELYDPLFIYQDESVLYKTLARTMMYYGRDLGLQAVTEQRQYFVATFATTIKRICDIVFRGHREEYPTYADYLYSS